MSNDPDYVATQKARRAKRDALRAQQPMSDEPRSAAEAEDMLREAREELASAAEYHERELADMRAERDHWKANHDNQVAIKRVLTVRPDLPHEIHPQRAEFIATLLRVEDERDAALAERDRWMKRCDDGWNHPDEIARQLNELRVHLRHALVCRWPADAMFPCAECAAARLAAG